MGKFYFRRHMAPLEEGDEGYGETYEPVHNDEDASSTSSGGSSANGGNRSSTSSFSEGTAASSAEKNSASAAARARMPCATGGAEDNSYEEMTMSEIMCGKGDYYPGLIPLVYSYLDLIGCDSQTMVRVDQYLEHIKNRAEGKLVTPATFIRRFVRSHPDYKQDSVVSDSIAYDLMVACKDIGEGKRKCKEMLGNITIPELSTAAAWDVKLDLDVGARADSKAVQDLLKRYARRNAEKAAVPPPKATATVGGKQSKR
jgi:glutamate--cysteine ligase catalytic subunit